MRQFINIVEDASGQSRAMKLFRQFGGKVYSAADLPQAGKNAIRVYYVEELGQEVDPASQWGYVEIPTEALTQAIGGHDDHDDFQSYHQEYISSDMPDHPSAYYAIILDDDDVHGELIWDGWHRFHDYVRKGVEMIPAIIHYA